jgi:hypothetical protein
MGLVGRSPAVSHLVVLKADSAARGRRGAHRDANYVLQYVAGIIIVKFGLEPEAPLAGRIPTAAGIGRS